MEKDIETSDDQHCYTNLASLDGLGLECLWILVYLVCLGGRAENFGGRVNVGDRVENDFETAGETAGGLADSVAPSTLKDYIELAYTHTRISAHLARYSGVLVHKAQLGCRMDLNLVKWSVARIV